MARPDPPLIRLEPWRADFNRLRLVLELRFVYERVEGFFRNCGLLEHETKGCDKLMLKEKEGLR
ncbi:hypothetical protein RchiOBHm_Chr1g0350971 [Rosa chinensis]|uniref:Zinc knuckle CX2CX4HX4C domain-containing protein n=1 Tax=Rosa chinensis TaxID=74649 RepID=A0A2P6SG90_ROSCH|nr:hypothetical protein RchiOBHm_Chr1g0350971 [Rosa chinensis]